MSSTCNSANRLKPFQMSIVRIRMSDAISPVWHRVPSRCLDLLDGHLHRGHGFSDIAPIFARVLERSHESARAKPGLKLTFAQLRVAHGRLDVRMVRQL